LGEHEYGQATVPDSVNAGHDVIAISAGGWHSLALKSDGTVVAWGANDRGQTNVPAGLSHVMKISAGGCVNLALVNTVNSGIAQVNVTGGNRSLNLNAINVSDVTLDGTPKATNVIVPLGVVDATGTGNGWHVTLTTTPFTGTGGKAQSHPLPSTSLHVSSVTSAPALPNGASPGNVLDWTGAPTNIFSAATDTGMGTFGVTPAMTLTIPANAYAGTYQSIFTVAITTGP
jgi:Regulator of chromosome condensation (RCC1) repeat/WxL domain surface cell wall-binding